MLRSELHCAGKTMNLQSNVSGIELRRRVTIDHTDTGNELEDDSVELKQFIETNGHFSLVRNFHLADAFTLMNGFCGAQSLFMSGRFLVTSDPWYIWAALWFPFFGAIFDYLDGKIARWRKSSSMLGQELDSLADLVSFGVAPPFAAFTLGLRSPLDTLLLTLFVCAGIARLARFNITAATLPHDDNGKARYFEGLPIPSSLALVIGMGVCLLLGRFDTAQGAWVPENALPFTGSWQRLLGTAGRGVPLGTFILDLSSPLYTVLSLGGRLGLYYDAAWFAHIANEYGTIVVHKISILWALWSMAMVSKTLRVPKP
ncbi:CDP-diacylglycerol--serine O-phosphatidyltransferase [Malassezia sp. CBS 17886]|nr:CDP-diacylglycerol--serine O-phosphatidyltransferase [Malassezia sp. CBS 17886]